MGGRGRKRKQQLEDQDQEKKHEEHGENKGEHRQPTGELEEGYYEIEDIRKQRVRKGQLQFLIKWRGWPETANTWEPYQNLISSSSLTPAQAKTKLSNPKGRKRGRKLGSKKQLPDPCAITLRAVTRTRQRNRLSSPSLPAPPPPEVDAAPPESNAAADEHGKNGACDHAPPSQQMQQQAAGSHVTGAKRRKSGSVKRFKQEEQPMQENGGGGGGGSSTGRSKLWNEGTSSTQGGEEGSGRLSITSIIKPVRYFATIKDNVQQVSITFKALRSDGKEVLVDDKELKANYPLVLIDFYEQHLRYSPNT